jgi:hypothetical protein
MHHSAGKASLHNEINKGAPPKKAAPHQAPAGGKSHPAPSAHSIEDHVGTHGPAIEIHVTHDKATGKHHVTSHHGANGKEMHHSVHGNPKDAHAMMGTAMGLNEGQTPDEEPAEAYGGTESPEEEAAESQRVGGIPGLA